MGALQLRVLPLQLLQALPIGQGCIARRVGLGLGSLHPGAQRQVWVPNSGCAAPTSAMSGHKMPKISGIIKDCA